MADHDQENENITEQLEEDQVSLDSQAEKTNPTGEFDGADGIETGDDVSQLKNEIERLQLELQQAKENALRAVAEAQNARRRAEQDVEKAHKFGLDKFVNDMLPVADNLQRAVDSSKVEGVETATVVEGVELTLKSLIDGLKRHKVEQLNPEGEPFDPEQHQAMTAIAQPDVEPNTVINVFQCGYTLHGRLVRPAMVVVSKAE